MKLTQKVLSRVPIQPVVPIPDWCKRPPTEHLVELAKYSTEDIAAEFLARIVEKQGLAENYPLVDLGSHVRLVMESVLDVHMNLFSRRRYADMFHGISSSLSFARRPIRTTVDVGCGSWNPLGMSFLGLLLGVRRAYAFDLGAPTNDARTVKALAELAEMMLIDPRSITGDFAIEREAVLRNCDGFDLAKLRRGDRAGIDEDRLRHRITRAENMPLADGEADLVSSNAFLEHVLAPEDVVAELSRVTSSGGIGVHLIDAIDHRMYIDASLHPLACLKEPPHLKEFLITDANQQVIDFTMNRLRPHQFCGLFERHGFEVLRYDSVKTTEVSAKMRAGFVEPYRSLPIEVLSDLIGRVVVRKR